MKEITIHARVALVDDCDFEWLSSFAWHLHNGTNGVIYAHRTYPRELQRWLGTHGIFMHRQILQAPKGMDVDHINGNGLDNQKSNLRLCTRRQNLANQRLRASKTIPYKGVYFVSSKPVNPYHARLHKDYNGIHIGCFPTPEEAARAYDKAALEAFGEYAQTNAMLGLLK
jgi:hypothetical protein